MRRDNEECLEDRLEFRESREEVRSWLRSIRCAPTTTDVNIRVNRAWKELIAGKITSKEFDIIKKYAFEVAALRAKQRKK